MNMLALGFGNFGGPDLFIILLIVLVLFGAKKLPELARSLGQSMNEFRKAREEFDRELHTAANDVKNQPQSNQPQSNQPQSNQPQSYQPAQNVQPAQPAGQANQSQPQVTAGNEQRPQA
jgi:sec-independent protein translocase protein TatA